MKAFRLRLSSVARAAANRASGLRDRLEQGVQQERRILRRRQRSSVYRSPNQNAADRRHDDQAESQMQGKVRPDRFRRRTVSKDLSVSDSAHRFLPAQANTGNVAEVRHRGFVNRWLRQVVENLWMKRAADKEDRRAFKGSRHNSEVVRLAQRNVARHRGSQKGARENRKKEHHHRGHNNSDTIVAATPEPKIPGSLVL
jgi:hypothetical protein